MKGIAKFAIYILSLAIFFLGGFFVRDAFASSAPNTQSLSNLFRSPNDRDDTPTETFQKHYNIITSRYARDVDESKLRYAGMSGLVSALGDPHTNFLEPRIAEAFATETTGNFVGIGARLTDEPLGTKIVSVFGEGPAKEGGIQAGDIITEVDGNSVAGQAVDEIVEQIRGESGTDVTLTIVREGEVEPIKKTLTRRSVVIPTVEHKIVDGNIGYIQISGFAGPTGLQFRQAIKELNKQKVKGIIMDFRSNPGGLLTTAQEMLSVFFDNKVVISMKQRGNSTKVVRTNRGQVIKTPYPLVVLVNEDSASASEIFAGVMRDYRKATIVGQHTYGKASVQDLHPLPQGASAKITIAKYFLPGGEDISRKVDEDSVYISGGIKPSVEVEFDFENNPQFAIPTRDSQLDAAIKVIRQKQGTP